MVGLLIDRRRAVFGFRSPALSGGQQERAVEARHQCAAGERVGPVGAGRDAGVRT
jgi:hypothetical protein